MKHETNLIRRVFKLKAHTTIIASIKLIIEFHAVRSWEQFFSNFMQILLNWGTNGKIL